LVVVEWTNAFALARPPPVGLPWAPGYFGRLPV